MIDTLYILFVIYHKPFLHYAKQHFALFYPNISINKNLKSVHTVELPAFEKKACAQALRRAGLKRSIEMAPSGFAFWNPDGQPYETELAVL